VIVRQDLEVPFAVRDLVVAYRAEPVLWNVTWSARPGALSAIVGPNGAGKSTLLNAAVGLVPTVSGEATFPITAAQVVEMGITRGSSWLVPDFLPQWSHRLLGRSQVLARKKTRQALERVGMQDFARRPIGELSGGQQQRVFLARALAQEADLYLLDEPFAGVDVATEEILTHELRQLALAGKTVVAVHHDLEDVADRFDDVVILNRELIASGRARETLTEETIARAFRQPRSPMAQGTAPPR
jgi:manganese/zinc/iron transport system ATP- binding protein